MSSPMIRTAGSRSISSIIASRIASRYDFSLMVTLSYGPRSMFGDDVREQPLGRRHGTLFRELHGLRRFLDRRLVHRPDVVVAQAAYLGEARAEDDDGRSEEHTSE